MIPFAAVPGFVLNAELREVAAHYGVRTAWLRRGSSATGRSGRRLEQRLSEARDALFWKLIVGRGFPAARAGALLNCTAKTVREGAERHARRIRDFRSAAGIDT